MVDRRKAPFGASLAAVLASACGDAPNEPPSAMPVALEVAEDAKLMAQLSGRDPEGQAISFRLAKAPAHGSASIDFRTGQLSYQPSPDFFGSDFLTFVVTDPQGASSAPATISITVTPVNDAPVITVPQKAQNSAYSYETRIDFTATDVDSTELFRTVSIEPADVARVRLDGDSIVVEPLRRGNARIHLLVSDTEFDASALVQFEVTDVTKTKVVSFDDPGAQAVAIRNDLDRVLEFKLANDGFPSFASLEEVAAFVEQLPAAYQGEQFPSKLWRFIRDNVSHDYPLTEELWLYDPLITLNSLGWGFCSNVASLYVRLARAAGYEARVWGIGGHVVPEVRAGSEWQMFDPDLAVFYFDRTGRIAGVAQLASDPSLVTDPENPIHSVSEYPSPYNSYVASLYASVSDNAVAPEYDGPEIPLDGTVRLPAGATLIYPGLWDDAPIGYDGSRSFPVTSFRHAAMTLPEGFTGNVTLPWMIRAIQGTGRVRVNGQDYEVGSKELRDLLIYPRTIIRDVEVLHAEGELRLVLYMNVARNGLKPDIEVSVTGLDVWAASIEHVSLPPENRLPLEQSKFIGIKPKSRLEQ